MEAPNGDPGQQVPGDGIAAYDLPKRIATYDADMDIMHPNRDHMLRVAVGLLPFPREQDFLALDLGVGTGCFSQLVLEVFPNARIIAIDGAASMLEIAAVRLDAFQGRVEFRTGDFRDLEAVIAPSERGKLVISSFALHHLDRNEKVEAVARCTSFLEPGGWFLNADLVRSDSPILRNRYQELRVQGIMQRAEDSDPRFRTSEQTHSFLEAMEAREGDQPLAAAEDLEILQVAGLKQTGIAWMEHREAVMAGTRHPALAGNPSGGGGL
ncbi:MAG: class I SAM-dependent methyltransferase [bacterium]|nr:class I SAM-dependent methyltransferase [bacterium]